MKIIDLLLEAEMQAVISSNIDEIGYEYGDDILEVWFLSGGRYIYYGVPQKVYDRFLKARSKGKYFWRYIRGFYDYDRIG